MKSRQIRIVAGTAIVSFALGLAVSPLLLKPDAGVISEDRQTKSSGRNPSESLPDDAGEITGRTRAGKREEKKKPAEARISLPLKTVANIVKEQQLSADLRYFSTRVENALPLLGASEQETTDVLALINRMKAEIYAEEKKHLKIFEADATEIRLDNSSMNVPYQAISQRTQESIRGILPAELAEVLISSINWHDLYNTHEAAFPRLNIERSSSGRMTAWARDANSGSGETVDPKFLDDGTPIPAAEVFKDDRWKPFLKGLTLLPQNEK